MSDEHKEEHGGGEAHGGGGHKGGHGGAPHAEHEEHEGAPEWLISFADNVALMMGFFVILLAMNMDKPASGGVGGEGKYPSEVPTQAMTDFAIEMRAAFNHPVDINSTNPAEQELVQRLKERKKEGGKTKQNGVDGKDKAVQATRPSDWIKTVAFASFLDYESQLTAIAHQSKPIVEKHEVPAAKMMSDMPRIVKLFEKHRNVKTCLSGHIHDIDEINYQGVKYLCDGAVCGAWWKGKHDDCQEGYALIDLYQDGTVQRTYQTYGWAAAKD